MKAIRSPARSAAATSMTAKKKAVPPARKAARGPAASPARKAAAGNATSASALIDAKIASLGDWRGAMLARLRAIVRAADPGIVEEWKWSVPVWSHGGILCTGETYKAAVKMTFARGASLPDPSRLFNASLDGNVRRAIDFHEGDEPDAAALQALVRAAVALNAGAKRG